ncbi:CTLH/CRA C-terminal to lish motif domain-containing protein, partial [Vararia minispora EC-137]
RALVLDYLIHHSYTETARAFAAESVVRHLDADGDEISRPEREGDKVVLPDKLLAEASLRRSVQERILSGNVDVAIERLNAHFPDILSSSSKPSPVPEPEPAKAPVATAVPGPPPPIRTLVPLSVDPARLYLDLRILAFIEASRTVPLGNPLPPTSSSSSPEALADARDFNALLGLISELQDRISKLEDPEERAEYTEELNRVTLLIAFKDPERRPAVSKYLTQSRREDVANEINYAMLYRAGQSPVSSLELAIRQTYAVFGYLHESGYRIPSSAIVPPGVCLSSAQQT